MRIFLNLLTNRIFTICFCLATTVFTAQAATLTVTKTADTNDGTCDSADCSLREAIAIAASGDTIVFASPLFDTPQIITLSDDFAALTINKSLTVTGASANLLTVRRAFQSALYRVFDVSGSGAQVFLNKMTVTGGRSGAGGGIYANGGVSLTVTDCVISANNGNRGAGIFVTADSNLTLARSTVSGNNANGFSGGGGIHNEGVLTVTNSTISGNRKTNETNNGGGIWTNNTTTITNSTITNNDAGGTNSAVGIYRGGGSVTIRGSIVAGNQNNASSPDVASPSGAFTSGGYNLIGSAPHGAGFTDGANNDQAGTLSSPLNPRLDSLANYGGKTPTHRLQTNSPAIDKGNSFGLTTDQREKLRPTDNPGTANASDGADIGSFESEVFLTVTKVEDTNDGACNADCSLREAINIAGTGNVIEFSSLFNAPQIITLSDAAGFQGLIINKNLTINGKGAQLLTIRRNPASSVNFRIFTVNGANVILNGMTVTGGKTVGSNARSGGIYSDPTSNLTINDCHITDNEITSVGSVKGGGISAQGGTLVINNSTVSNNRVISGSTTNSGGGIFTSLGTVTTIINSTFSGNTVTDAAGFTSNLNGGGVFNGGVMTLMNSTVTDNGAVGAASASGIFNNSNLTIGSTIAAGNRNNSAAPDVADGTVISHGFNLVGNVGSVSGFNRSSDQVGSSSALINPLLEALALNGGSTPTHALLAGSPAIDAGDALGNFTDQRGSPRPIDNPAAPPAPGGDNSDVGSFESGRFPALVVTKTEDTNDGECDEDCSLREAIAAASARGNEIVFSSLFDTPQTITLSDAAGFRELSISDKSLSITGKGAQLLTVRRDPASSANFSIFNIRRVSAANLGVSLSGMKITGGFSSTAAGGINVSGGALTLIACHVTNNSNGVGNGDAGGIAANSGASLTVLNSTISNNTVLNNAAVDSAGGINFYGNQFIMTNSTVSGNVVSGNDGSGNSGGLLLSLVSGTVSNSTITDNQANGTNTAGGVIGGSNATARNTIIAGNRNNSTVPDVRGAFTSGGFNLVGSPAGNNFVDGVNNDKVGTLSSPFNPLLDALGNYGGATPTHRLQTNSPAIDKGYSFDLTTDQRGAVRPFDVSSISNASDGADIGAFEAQSAPGAGIAGTMVYGTTPTGQSAKYVAGVTITASGASAASVTTNSSGAYSLSNLTPGGQYTVTPTKTGDANGITPFDATLVLRCVAAGTSCLLTPNQRTAADTNNSDSITPFDAAQILRYVAANAQTNATGQVGNWKFVPASRGYDALNAALTGENYEVILIGEVNGDWMPPAGNSAANENPVRDELISTDNDFDSNRTTDLIEQETDVSQADLQAVLPINVLADRRTTISIPVFLNNPEVKTISGYSFTVQYDPKALQPISEAPFDVDGTLSQDSFLIVVDTKMPGRIGIAASKSSGAGSISAGSNTLVYLRFAVIGKLSGKFDSADLTSASTVLGEVNLEDELGKRIFTANARKGGRFVPALSF